MKKLRKLAPLLFIFTLFLVASCDLINPSEPQPAYLNIDTFRLTTNVDQGTTSSRIRDSWVYVDGQYIGTFELPSRIPVLESGYHKLVVGGGIYENGVSATRSAYPMYLFKTYDSIYFEPGKTITIDTIDISYINTISFPWLENFDNPSFSISTTSNSLASLGLEQVNPFEGQGSLIMKVGTNDSILECATTNYINLSEDDDIFLEMNYKCDGRFYVGLISNNITGLTYNTLILLNPSTNWNKIYLNFTKLVRQNGSANGYKIFFYLQRETEDIENTVYLDNIKLVHN